MVPHPALLSKSLAAFALAAAFVLRLYIVAHANRSRP